MHRDFCCELVTGDDDDEDDEEVEMEEEAAVAYYEYKILKAARVLHECVRVVDSLFSTFPCGHLQLIGDCIHQLVRGDSRGERRHRNFRAATLFRPAAAKGGRLRKTTCAQLTSSTNLLYERFLRGGERRIAQKMLKKKRHVKFSSSWQRLVFT